MFQASGDEEFTQLLSMTTNYPSWQREFKESISKLLSILSERMSVSAKNWVNSFSTILLFDIISK